MADTRQDSTYAILCQWVTVGRFMLGERRAVERDLFVAGQFLRRACQKAVAPVLPMEKEKMS